MTRWSEAQLAAVRRAPPTRREPRKPAAPAVLPLADNEIEIPWLTPLPNSWQRMHFRSKRRQMQAIAQVIALKFPRFVGLRLERCRITVTRLSSFEPDPDAKAFVKPILDALQPPSKRHPYGVGTIVDDSSKNVELVTEWRPHPRGNGRVIVRIEPC